MFHYVETAGSCGPIPDALISLNPGPQGVGAGCTLHSERATEGNCKIERDVTCGTVHVVGVTTQETQDGSVISGTLSFNEPTCSSTYRLTATRQ